MGVNYNLGLAQAVRFHERNAHTTGVAGGRQAFHLTNCIALAPGSKPIYRNDRHQEVLLKLSTVTDSA